MVLLLLQLIMFVLVAYVSAQFYPGYPYYNGPYYGLQHFFAPINSKITPPMNSPFAAPILAKDKVKTDAQSVVDADAKVTKPTCDCNIVIGSPNGCKIVKAAPKGYSCNCQLNGLSCSGTAERCIGNDPVCLNPDTSIKSCLKNIYSDCDGYSAPSGCSCKYRSGGCYIASPAPAYYACHCSYVGFWTCSGRPVPNYSRCRVLIDLQACLNPGTSKLDCLAGNSGSSASDCGGY